MTTKTKTAVRAAAPLRAPLPLMKSAQTPAWTMDERLQRIEALGQRIAGYVRFMCQVASQNGSSAAAKERAVGAFYEQMMIVERQLGAIQEEFQLE